MISSESLHLTARGWRGPTRMGAMARLASGVIAAAFSGRLAAVQTPDARQIEQIEERLRQEGQAVVSIADEAARRSAVPSDFPVEWHNDFLKAQGGTFIPFIVSIGPAELHVPAVLLYVRAARRLTDTSGGRTRRGEAEAGVVLHPFEEIYPVELPVPLSHPVRVARGFPLAPGEYEITVVVRERERGGGRRDRPLASVLRRPLSVPDFSGPGLAMSSVILADRLTVLPQPPPASELRDRPYVIAGRDISPSPGRVFRPAEELIVVFLVYNPLVTEQKHFDLEVEYHFFRRNGAGEAYFNRTEPQRFNPGSLGPHYDPSAGQPIMAGQGIPLAGFRDGEYRLAIGVKDLIAGQTISRDVTFTVRSRAD